MVGADILQVRRSDERGKTETDWLTSHHSFTFGNYRDEEHTNIGPLQVLNEDYVDPGGGFTPHRHANREIITYVLDGAINHTDSSGHSSTIWSGEVQFMRAGDGIVHSEKNASDKADLRFLQIWFKPETERMEPEYEKFRLDVPEDGTWVEIVGGEEGVEIDADVRLLTAKLPEGEEASQEVDGDRQYYFFLIDGKVDAMGKTLEQGDALHATGKLTVKAEEDSHLLFFDLPEK